MKTILTIALALSCMAQSPGTRLRDIHTVYVTNLGDSEGANLIREKLINELIKSKRLQVTEAPDQADAVLSGAAVEEQVLVRGRYDASLVLRLTTSQKMVLWTDDEKPSHFSRSMSSSVAKRAIGSLLKAIKKDEKVN
jgi:hypothetical protein